MGARALHVVNVGTTPGGPRHKRFSTSAAPSLRSNAPGTKACPLVSTGESRSRRPVCEITASVQLAACTSSPMYRSIGASFRWGLLNRQLEDPRRSREAPTFATPGDLRRCAQTPSPYDAYAHARTDHPCVMTGAPVQIPLKARRRYQGG